MSTGATELDELMKYLETAEEKHLSYMKVGDKILKLVTSDQNFVLLTVAEVTYKSGKARKFKDIKVIYSSNNNFVMSDDQEWTFITSRSYRNHGFWEIPADLLPEYFL